jgi:hypothetical protein
MRVEIDVHSSKKFLRRVDSALPIAGLATTGITATIRINSGSMV